jgi:hypothetical protein
MKLFITNRSLFENTIEGENELNPNSFNSHQIHKKAFTELQTHVISKNAIPLQIAVDIDQDLNIVFFEFINKKNDVYFYEFQTH